MTRNMGTLDRSLRAFVVAPVAIVVALMLGASALGGVILFVVAGIMLATAVTAFCPTYTVFGISTSPHGLHRVSHGIRHGHA
jgi:Inner membrane protein YgaP-like, transmembrane domain